MPNRDKTGPDGKGKLTGRGKGGCNTTDTTDTTKKPVSTEKQLENSRGKGLGPCGDGTPRGGGGGGKGRGRRRGKGGITYFT